MSLKRFIIANLIVMIFLTISFNGASQNKWGSQWKMFTYNYVFDGDFTDKLKLKSNYIRAIEVDQFGSIWIAVKGNIFVYKDKKYNRISTKRYQKPKYVNALKFDSKGVLWIGTNQGLFKYENESFIKVEVPSIWNITEINVDENDNVYVAGYIQKSGKPKGAGISIYDGTSWKNYNAENSDLTKDFIEDITIDKAGNIWMVAGMDDTGVTKFDGTSWTLYNKENSGLKTNIVRAIEIDKDGVAWFGTPKGLVNFDGTNWNTVSLKDIISPVPLEFLKKLTTEPELITIAIDQNDVMWIGTEGNGVIRREGDNITVMKMENSPITSDHIRRIHIDAQNRKWFITGMLPETKLDRFVKDYSGSSASFAGVVMYQDPKYDFYKDWEVLNTFTSNQPGNAFYEMIKGKDGSMWLASQGYGIINYKDNNWKVYSPEKQGLTGSTVIAIGVGNNGEIYGASQLKGIFQVEGDGLIHHTKEQMGYSYKSMKDVLVDNEGNLWMAHINGVDKFKDGKIEHFKKKAGLLSNNIYSLKKDSKGRVWVCTTKGISVYDKGTWTQYDKKNNGLKGYIFDVIEDKNGNFFAGGGKGLYKLDGDQWSLIDLEGEGAPRYLSVECMSYDNEGVLWLGTTTKSLYTWDGTNWKNFDKDNSGVIFNKIIDIEPDANGDMWITMAKGMKMASTTMPKPASAAGPNLDYEIKKKIEAFEPSASIVIFRK